MFEIDSTKIDGCCIIHPFVSMDDRGSFVKLFNSDVFVEKGLCSNFREQYYSISNMNVIRGMHFQLPPYQQDKMVHCLAGKAIDVVVDLRKDSPTYGQYVTFSLDAENPVLVYIAKGLAHGFLSCTDKVVMLYNVETVYNKQCDAGILWSSFGYEWPCVHPIISNRDRMHPVIQSFNSPF